MTYNVLEICDVEQRKNWEVTGSTIKSETSRCTAGLNSCVPAEPEGISYPYSTNTFLGFLRDKKLDQGLPWVEGNNERFPWKDVHKYVIDEILKALFTFSCKLEKGESREAYADLSVEMNFQFLAVYLCVSHFSSAS